MSQPETTKRPALDDATRAAMADAVARALEEDVGTGDVTAGLVPADVRARAELRCREPAVLAGRPWFDEVYRQLDPGIEIRWSAEDGDMIAADTVICRLEGPARALLTGERTALNFLQTLSATATRTRHHVRAVAGTSARVLDTRKTLPGLRLAQKYAVRCGGGTNHRLGLWDAVLIKENHVLAAGSITAAVEAALALGTGRPVEVEVESLDEMREALAAGARRILLDNFSIAELGAAVALRDAEAPDATLEASGGVTLAAMTEIARTGVDFVSVGALTKDVAAVDLSMRFELRAP
jgi:nicotinate-nucleotide pyrophosphorylase (carboxylating)